MRGNFFSKKFPRTPSKNFNKGERCRMYVGEGLVPHAGLVGKCRRLIRLRPCILWELDEIRFVKFLFFIEVSIDVIVP
jgi:hypothetical protein